MRRLVVPDAAPPYDDEQPNDNQQRYSDEPGAGEPGAGEPGAGEPGADERSPAGELPPDNAGLWASQFAQVLAETLAGSRPAQQLTPWTTEQARQRIRQLGPTLVADQRPRVRRIVTSAPSQDVLELTAVVGFGPRVRALGAPARTRPKTDHTGQPASDGAAPPSNQPDQPPAAWSALDARARLETASPAGPVPDICRDLLLPGARVAMALLELAARPARAGRVPADPGVVRAVRRARRLVLSPARAVLGGRAVAQATRALRPGQASR